MEDGTHFRKLRRENVTPADRRLAQRPLTQAEPRFPGRPGRPHGLFAGPGSAGGHARAVATHLGKRQGLFLLMSRASLWLARRAHRQMISVPATGMKQLHGEDAQPK